MQSIVAYRKLTWTVESLVVHFLPLKALNQPWSQPDSDALARLSQAETYVDDIIAISDDTTGEIQRDKLRVDSRKWIASKINPGKWGDKLAIETTSKVSILDHLNEVINVTPSAEIETDRITN